MVNFEKNLTNYISLRCHSAVDLSDDDVFGEQVVVLNSIWHHFLSLAHQSRLFFVDELIEVLLYNRVRVRSLRNDEV